MRIFFKLALLLMFGLLAVISYGQKSENITTKIDPLDYIINDYMVLLYGDVNEVMNSKNKEFKKLKDNIEKKVIDSVKKAKNFQSDWTPYRKIYFVAKDIKTMYCLIETTVSKEELVKKINESFNKKFTQKKVEGLTFFESDGIYGHFLSDNLLIGAEKKSLPKLIKLLKNKIIPQSAKNNKNLQRDYAKLNGKPFWASFNLEKSETGFGYIDIKNDVGNLFFTYSAPKDKKGYNEAKIKLSFLPMLLSSFLSNQQGLRGLSNSIQNDLKLKFDDKTKSIIFDFEFNFQKYNKLLTEKTIKKKVQKNEKVY